MDCDVYLSEDGKYIIANVKSPMTIELGQRCGVDAHALGDKTGVKRYLFDLRGAPNVEATTRNYEFANKQMADTGFSRKARSALLTDPSDRSHDYIAGLMRTAGYNVKIFDDEQAAIDWLLE
jgi:hypothetical protein